MPYTINIPLATDFISASQPLINENFTEIQTAFSVDHFPLGSAAGVDGKHMWVHMPNTVNNPASLNTETCLYSGLSQFANTTDLFFQPAGAVGGFPANTLRAWTETLNQVTAVQDGYNYIGGGRICIRYNRVNPPNNNPTNTYLWSGLGRPFLNPPIVIATVLAIAAPAGTDTFTVSITNVTVNGFDYSVRFLDGNPANIIAIGSPFYFIAIGNAG